MHCNHVMPRLLVYASIQKRPGRLAAESFGSFTPALPERATRQLKRESWQSWNLVGVDSFSIYIYTYRYMYIFIYRQTWTSFTNCKLGPCHAPVQPRDNQLMCIHYRSWLHLACNCRKGQNLTMPGQGVSQLLALPCPCQCCAVHTILSRWLLVHTWSHHSNFEILRVFVKCKNKLPNLVLYLLGTMAVASKSSWKWPILRCSALPMQPPARTRNHKGPVKVKNIYL